MTILGISCFYHDAAAALIQDGKVVAAAEEERFSRIKHDSGFPHQAIDFCLGLAQIKPNNIDYVIFYEKPFVKFERITISSLATAPFAPKQFVNAYKTWLKDKLWIKSVIASKLKIASKKIVFSGHHISHAASSYYTSPFDKSAILTCDGVGEWTTTAWGIADKNKLYLKQEIKFPHSLGLFYSTFTQFLGFEINEGEYKVMGLAPYGKPRYVDKVEKLVRQTEDGAFKLNLKYFKFHISDKLSFSDEFTKLFKISPLKPSKSDQVKQTYADIAASAQKVLEDKLLVIAKNVKEKTGMENLCYAGGVALNGVANWRIFKEAGFKNIFIHPAAGDSGGALGAALYLYHHVLNNKKTEKSSFNVYLGKENSEEEIDNFISNGNIKSKKLTDKKMQETLIDKLKKKRVIGWVQGRFEWGPRALGARSILADPRSKKMKDIVNRKIKFREGFRPFAPVVLYEKGEDFFEIEKPYQKILEHMLAVVPVKKGKREMLGAITHIDGTARPQLIKEESNKKYYHLVKAFGAETGVPVLLNTSFNLKGEPVVNSCEEAYATFQKSGIDSLVIGNYLIEK